MASVAISEVLRTAYWPYFRDYFDRMDVWMDKVRDYSAEFRMGGKTLEIDIDTTHYGSWNPAAGDETPPGSAALTDRSTTVTEDSTAAQLLRGTPALTKVAKVTFTLDKYQDIDILLGRLQQRRHHLDWRGRIQAGSLRAMMYEKNKYIRGIFDAMTGDYVLDKDDVAGLETTAANWGNADYRQALIDTLKEASLKADGWDWPPENRRVVMGPENYAEVVQWLQDKNAHFVEARVNDRAFVEGPVAGTMGVAGRKRHRHRARPHQRGRRAAVYVLSISAARRGLRHRP